VKDTSAAAVRSPSSPSPRSSDAVVRAEPFEAIELDLSLLWTL
jgi:hypothetical protein